MIGECLVAIAMNCSVLVTRVGPSPSFFSGTIATFLELSIEYSGKTDTLYLPYLSETQTLPTVGDRCRFDLLEMRLSGVVSGKGIVLPRAKIVDAIDCNGGT